jgi:hypothetical protein
MKTFNLEDHEAEFVVKAIGQLPTQSGAFPLFQKLAEQFNAQVPPSEQPKEETVQ